MENDFEIELEGETAAPREEQALLPQNVAQIGHVEPDDVKVYVRQAVYQALRRYSAADTSHERGTVLLGSSSVSLGKTHVVISAYIEAKYTDASASTLTFTHETWDYVHKERESKYPELAIVGWQHTHPDYGIFLSNYDLFIHENFFDLPFQVAYVIDPVRGTEGFFQWRGGKIEKLGGFFVYDDVGVQIRLEKKTPSHGGVNPPKVNGRAVPVAIAALAVSVLGLAAGGFWMHSSANSRISALQKKIAALESAPAAPAETEAGSAAGTEAAPPAGAADEVVFFRYTVQTGDHLYGVCRKFDIPFETYGRVILALNGIENPDAITEGEQLLLPRTRGQ